MPFHSSLLALHRLRIGLEKMVRLRLQLLHARIAALTAKQREIEAARQALRQSNFVALKGGTTPAALRVNSAAALEAEQRRILRLQQELATQLHKAETEFIIRRQQREILENAIALQNSAYEAERNRREQAAVDEEVLQRYARVDD